MKLKLKCLSLFHLNINSLSSFFWWFQSFDKCFKSRLWYFGYFYIKNFKISVIKNEYQFAELCNRTNPYRINCREWEVGGAGYYYITIDQQKTFLQNCPVQQKNLNQPLLKSLCSRKLIWLLDVYRDIHAWIYSYLMIITLTFYKKNYLKPIKLLFFWMTLTLTF